MQFLRGVEFLEFFTFLPSGICLMHIHIKEKKWRGGAPEGRREISVQRSKLGGQKCIFWGNEIRERDTNRRERGGF